MDPAIAASVESLRLMPDNLEAALKNRPDDWLDSRHAEDTLSPRETVGHLIKGEDEDWVPRARMILDVGESQAFSPFDPYASNDYSHTTPVHVMLGRFRQLRGESIKQLLALGLSEETLEKRGTHPRHGSVTLRELVHTWAAHDLYHLGQIYKAFSAPYKERIGPWQASLNIPDFN
jgi:uncharacterized damage-inducible protein DinB